MLNLQDESPMNSIIHITLAVLAFSQAGYADAADEINRQDTAGLTPSGHISVGNLSTADEINIKTPSRMESHTSSSTVLA